MTSGMVVEPRFTLAGSGFARALDGTGRRT
jgi:hypothetical protein